MASKFRTVVNSGGITVFDGAVGTQLTGSGGIIVFDGAMGTQLTARGAELGPAANVSAPETVLAVHRAYREAGADVLMTNTLDRQSSGACTERPGGRTGPLCVRGVRAGASRRSVATDSSPATSGRPANCSNPTGQWPRKPRAPHSKRRRASSPPEAWTCSWSRRCRTRAR